jgi:hypothetical protein
MVELVTINKALPGDSPDYLINKYKKIFLLNNKSKIMFSLGLVCTFEYSWSLTISGYD